MLKCAAMRASFGVAVLGTLLLLSVTAWSQQSSLTPQPMRIDKVKDGLYVVRGPFLPCGSRNGCGPGAVDDGVLHEPGDVAMRVTSEGVILIDDKYPHNVKEVLEKVRSVTTQPIRYLLNTHHHADHASGNPDILAMGIDIIAHRNIRQNFIRNKQDGAPPITFNDRADVHLGGVEVQMIYLGRGHTNGDTVIYFPDLRTIHAGDLVIDGLPHIDYDNGGSFLQWIPTLKKMLEIDFDTVIPGHGDPMPRSYVVDRIRKMETLAERMRELVKRRVPKDQLAAQIKLDDLGWAKTVSTRAFLTGVITRFYDEIAAAQSSERAR